MGLEITLLSQLTIVFFLGLSFLICSMGTPRDTAISETAVTSICCTFTLGQALCVGRTLIPVTLSKAEAVHSLDKETEAQRSEAIKDLNPGPHS